MNFVKNIYYRTRLVFYRLRLSRGRNSRPRNKNTGNFLRLHKTQDSRIKGRLIQKKLQKMCTHLLEALGDARVVFVKRSGGREQGRQVEAAALVVQHVGVDLHLVHAADHLLDRAESELGHRLPVKKNKRLRVKHREKKRKKERKRKTMK